MAECPGRRFLKNLITAGPIAGSGALPSRAAKGTAAGWVTLGKSNFKAGTMSGLTRRELGQEPFPKLVRHDYDRGIRFLKTSESYDEMHKMLGIALTRRRARRRQSAGED